MRGARGGGARLLVLAILVAAPAAQAAPVYPWLSAPAVDDLPARFAPPSASRRIDLPAGSFGEWLRRLPLRPAGTAVHLFDGRAKGRQDVHAAVVELDVGKRDLQQCADAVMRLRAEYLYAAGRYAEIRFHPDAGRPRVLAYEGGADRARFASYLVGVFSDAGTVSLQAELPRVAAVARAVAPGDVLIQGGSPGHAVLVLDAADGSDGKRYLILGQSYMPAQDFHVLRNLGDARLSPWYDADALASGGLVTPEWRPFLVGDVHRFSDGKRAPRRPRRSDNRSTHGHRALVQ